MPVFHLNDETALIRTQDVLEAAKDMARKLGMIAEVRVVVGRFWEDGQLTGWTAKAKDNEEDLLLEVFVSKLAEETREFDRYARDMQALIDENERLKAALASSPTEQMREALRPFATFADALSDEAPENTALGLMVDGLVFGPGAPTIGHLRRARQALGGNHD